MPVGHPVVKSLSATLLSLAAPLALSVLLLTACGATATDNSGISTAHGFAAISNIPGTPYSWTDGIDATGVRTAQLDDAWEFRPTTELWSWVSGSGTQNEIYVASMPELSPAVDTWTWVGESNTAVAVNASGAQCHTANWVESGGNSWLACGDDLQANASMNDLWQLGP